MEWKHINVPNGNSFIFCNAYITGKAAMNIIVTHTPIVSTLDIQQVYEPFTKYGVNLFAFDFSGTGRSGGAEKDFSRQSIVRDLDIVVQYIKENFSDDIHLYGSTGIGGMFAQYYACGGLKVKSFAQFGCVDYKNTRGIGCSYIGAKMMSFVLRLLPNFHIIMNPPKYQGYNERQDNEVYDKLTQANPNLFKSSTKILNTTIECFIAPDSVISNGVSMPTLVFKTLHDRYFSKAYFDSYYYKLTCKKKLVEINNTHNSYFFSSEEFCEAAYKWFIENQ